MSRVELNLAPAVLRWARERGGYSQADLAERFRTDVAKVQDWETSGKVSYSRVERLAKFTHTPVGFLYLSRPPADELPIRDFRTVGNRLVRRASPDLLDTIYSMQLRQRWFRDDLIEHGSLPLPFVASKTRDDPVHAVANSMRAAMGLTPQWAAEQPTWTAALGELRATAERAGILVVSNGVVGNDTHRKLDPEEFRGFALVDPFAPLIFVNGTDAKAAQMFTLAHELAHIWLGAEGISTFDSLLPVRDETEEFCNSVAAELLVPESELRAAWTSLAADRAPFEAGAKRFKVSALVVARRALDTALISRPAFFAFYNAYMLAERRRRDDAAAGGSFWNNQNVRIGARFGRAVVRAVEEDRLLYRDAYRLTGLSSNAFKTYVSQMED